MKILSDLRSYYRGSRGRDQVQFYDLESSLPYFDQVNRILGRDKRRAIRSFLLPPRSSGDPLLEVGCGIGTFARFLATAGEEVIGIDISPRKIGHARQAPPPAAGRCSYHVGRLEDLGEGGDLDRSVSQGGRPGFRRIVASDVVEHLPAAPAETARRLRDLLTPGGQLVASVPSRLCVNDPGHIWRLSWKEWEEVFRSAGFHLERKRMSRICLYRFQTPLPLAMVLDLRRGDTA